MLNHSNKNVMMMPLEVNKKFIDRFWSKVGITANPKTCWEWQRGTVGGYGKFAINSISFSAHRVSYYLSYSKDPLDKLVCHSCDNPKCCNPDHLFLGTIQDNNKDSVNKNRSILYKGEKNNMAKLTDKLVLSIIDDYSQGNITQLQLSKKYKVSHSNIRFIISGKTWKHINDSTTRKMKIVGRSERSRNNTISLFIGWCIKAKIDFSTMSFEDVPILIKEFNEAKK